MPGRQGYIHVTNPAGQGPAGVQGPVGPAGAAGFIPKYGAFQYTGTQSITDITQAYVMPINQTDFSNDVTRSNGTRIVFPTAGVYNIQWSGQFTNTNSLPQDLNIWLRINGVDIVGSLGTVYIAGTHAGQDGHVIAGWNYFLQFAANQYLEIVWSASATGINLASVGASSSPTKPTTAALVVTANQVG